MATSSAGRRPGRAHRRQRPSHAANVTAPGTAAVEADQRGDLRQVRRDPADQRREGPLEDQAGAVEQVEQLAVLRGLVARVDRAPHRPGPGDAEHAAERDRVVGGQDRHLVARPDARPGQGPGDRRGQPLHVARSCGSARHGQARGAPGPATRPCRGSRSGAQLQVRCRTVRTGSITRPKLRSTPSSSRWPKAWQPDAKPARRGGCCSSE